MPEPPIRPPGAETSGIALEGNVPFNKLLLFNKNLDSLGSIFYGIAVHISRVKVVDSPINPGAHLVAPVLAQLDRGDVGVGVVQSDEGGGRLGFGVLHHLPVVLRRRHKGLLPRQENIGGVVVLVGVLENFMGACCHHQVTSKSRNISYK